MIFWILSRLEVTSGKVGKSEISVNVRIVRNMIVIALYTNCHCQKILLIISMALLISAVTKEKEEDIEETLEMNACTMLISLFSAWITYSRYMIQ